MEKTKFTFKDLSPETRWAIFGVVLMVGLIYYFSNPAPQGHYNYTFRVADNFLRGSVALNEKPPSWLNEFVPFEGSYYTVFPLGAIVTMIPFAFFKLIGAINDMPAAFIAGLTASACCWFLLLIAFQYELSRTKQYLLVLAMLFGTWTWTNLAFGGAWQLALGFAMLGELGAIYFTIFNRKPILAGLFFAMAFGNRTEVLLTAPIFMYLLVRPEKGGEDDKLVSPERKVQIKRLVQFCSVPFVLGISTLVYNYIRFHSFSDFGYSRIPGVLAEPWYNHGIFSAYYIPRQAWENLIKPWEFVSKFPYFKPNPFSSSVLWSSPFLLFALRFGSQDKALKYLSWGAIAVLTLLLWMHGNSGGWQFGYRYAIVTLPWFFIILLETDKKKTTILEWAAYSFSFAANLYATWLFHWTTYLKP